MSDRTENDTNRSEEPNKEERLGQADPVKRMTFLVVIVAIAIFILSLVLARLAPITDQARIQAYVIPVVSQVSGVITEVLVENDQVVEAREALFKIDPRDYELAVESARSELELAGQGVGANTASVATAQAKLIQAEANLTYVEAQGKRVFELEKKGVMAAAEGDKARTAISNAETQVETATTELEKSKQLLGEDGANNPRIRAAIAALKQAELDLSRTTVYAPSRGGVTNLVINDGNYASAGVPLMTFIDFDNVWLRAELSENSITNVQPGARVDITLDAAPGRVFPGTVRSIGFAVDNIAISEAGELAATGEKSGWMRSAQSFPVTVNFSDQETRGLMRLGGQADVQFYNDQYPLLNALGWIRIRLNAWLSYVY